jgi:hypothetical protein
VLTWKVACEVDREEKKIVRYKYFKGNYQEINEKLLSVEWEKEWKGVKVKDRWTGFVKRIAELIDEYIPVQRIRGGGHKYPVWLTGKIQRDIECRNKKWKKMIDHHMPMEVNIRG